MGVAMIVMLVDMCMLPRSQYHNSDLVWDPNRTHVSFSIMCIVGGVVKSR